ncbi:MAG: AAA family ATPase, partial [Bacteroidales bacterium]|nr:AAA family ATPase [Bacteroidales bacterium]
EARNLSENANLARESIQAEKKFLINKKELDGSYKELQKYQRIFDISYNEKERRASRAQLDSSNETYVRILREYEHSKEDAIRKKMVAFKVLSGNSIDEVMNEVKKEKPHIDKYYSLDEAGRKLFNYVPEFIFFEDFLSLLPDRIDLRDIHTENTNIEGYKAARSFLLVSGLDEDFFQQTNNRILKQKIEKLNKEITINFQDYWRQSIGKHNKIKINFELEHYDNTNPDKSGLPYIEFWIKDREERLYPKQRSRGVRWFLSFYLELQAAALAKNGNDIVILIDEPGVSLHARAQEDVLKVFDNIKEKVQIIYTTHSPHLIDLNKLYRLLAVQRAVEEDELSETKILDAKSLTTASTDTLSPIYSLMGIRLSEQKFIQKKNNIILEDIATFYYMKALTDMKNFEKQVFYLPATGVSNISSLVNMLLGWGIDFLVLTGANKEGDDLKHDLTKHLFANNEDQANKKLIQL